jgi:hypothetical protein
MSILLNYLKDTRLVRLFLTTKQCLFLNFSFRCAAAGTDAVALFNYGYLRKIFDVGDGENVMPRQLINNGIEQFETWTCHDRVSYAL